MKKIVYLIICFFALASCKKETSLTKSTNEYTIFGDSISSDKAISNIDMLVQYNKLKPGDTLNIKFKSKIKNVLGVELVKQRHDDAEILKSELKFEYADKVNLLNKNIFDIDFEEYKNKQIFIWFSNLCFDQTGIDEVFKKLKNTLPSGTIICCSKKPLENFGEFLNIFQVPMSWNKESNVYIYRL